MEESRNNFADVTELLKIRVPNVSSAGRGGHDIEMMWREINAELTYR
jgi:hypothetical protein